jgi:hypothetical protein
MSINVRPVYFAVSVLLVACQQQSFLETSDGNGHNHMTSCYIEEFVIDFAWVSLNVLVSTLGRRKMYSFGLEKE